MNVVLLGLKYFFILTVVNLSFSKWMCRASLLRFQASLEESTQQIEARLQELREASNIQHEPDQQRVGKQNATPLIHIPPITLPVSQCDVTSATYVHRLLFQPACTVGPCYTLTFLECQEIKHVWKQWIPRYQALFQLLWGPGIKAE